MTIDIFKATQECFEFLLEKQKSSPDLYFVPRIKNNNNRLDDGYFFLGNTRYMQISFWIGRDWKQKIHHIAFNVSNDGKVYYELSGTNNIECREYLKNLAVHLKDKTGREFVEKNNGYKWSFPLGDLKKDTSKLDQMDYLDYLNEFIENEKVIIDEYIEQNYVEWITKPKKDFHEKYVLPLVERASVNKNMFNQKLNDSELTTIIKEGKKVSVYTTVYERNPLNRKRAIEACRKNNNGKLVGNVCGFNFEEYYGELGKGYIEVHHIKPLSKNNGKEVEIDPLNDLICVCPNCHRMLHRLNVEPIAKNLQKHIIK
ncbi:MAG: HNH endonuclease [Aminipila sp.]